jgi:O-antigen ligase
MLEKVQARDNQHSPVIYLLVLLVALLPLLYFEPLHNPSQLPRYALVALVASVALITLALRNMYQVGTMRWHVTQFIALIFLILASLSSLWSLDVGSNLIEVMYLVSFMMLFFVGTQITDIRGMQLIMLASVVAGGIAALLGVLQHFYINPLQYRGPVMPSTFTFKNHAALYFDLIIPVAGMLIFILDNKKLKWLTTVCLGLCLGYIAESRTRGSYMAIGLVILIIAAAWLLNKQYRSLISTHVKANLAYIIVATIIVIVIVVPAGRNDLEWKKNKQLVKTTDSEVIESLRKNIDESSLDRLVFYRNSLGIIKDHPLIGTGYGTFWKAFRPYMNHPYLIKRSRANLYLFRLHNDILQVFTELGVLGGVIFLLLLVSILWGGVRAVKDVNLGGKQRLLVTGLLLSVLASLFHSIVDFPFHKPASAATFWLWSGFIVSIYLNSQPVSQHGKNSRRIGLGIALVSIFYLVIGSVFYYGFFRDNHYLYLAEQSMKKSDCAGATDNIEKAIDSFGLTMQTHVIRTRIHIACNSNQQQLFQLLNSELVYDDTNIQALLRRAGILLNSGYLQAAERDLQRVLFILPHDIDAKVGMARIQLQRGEKDEAIRALEAILASNPDNEMARKTLEAAGGAK